MTEQQNGGNITADELATLYGDALYCARLDCEMSLDYDRYDELMAALATKVDDICDRRGFDPIEVHALANIRLSDTLAGSVPLDSAADAKLMKLSDDEEHHEQCSIADAAKRTCEVEAERMPDEGHVHTENAMSR